MAREKSPNEVESDLRKAAEKFADAVDAARAAGFSVAWPGTVEALRTIEIGATGAVAADGERPVDLTPVPAGEPERAALAIKAQSEAKPTDKS